MQRRKTRRLGFPSTLLGVLAAMALAAEAGCGGSAGPTADKACADLATARCQERSMCSAVGGGAGPGASLVRTYGDTQTCLARETLACKNGLGAPQTGQSPGKVASCAGDLPTFSCQDFFDNNPPADCVAAGARANGAPCTFNGQCLSSYCQGTKTSACGSCADPPQPGADCTGSTCWHSQRCVASTMTCAAVVSQNGACDASHPCDNGLACVGDTATTMGTCQGAGTVVGAPCGGSMPGCDGTLGLYCAGPAGSKSCAAMALVGDGQPCGVLADGSHVGCAAGDCYTATGLAGTGAMGVCKAAVDAPAACDTMLGPGCLAPARCVVSGSATAGTCVVPVGTSCS
jgi:hypothetical protein